VTFGLSKPENLFQRKVLYLGVDDLKATQQILNDKWAFANKNYTWLRDLDPTQYERELDESNENYKKFYDFLDKIPTLRDKVLSNP
jgi:hypothetical protein